MIVQFDPDARIAPFRASDFYEQRRPGYGRKFIWAAEQAAARARETPHAGSRWPDTRAEPPLRRRKVPGFPSVSLAYAALPESIYVLAVIHDRREPGYWFKRLGKLDG